MFNGSIQMFSAYQIESLPVFDGIGIEMTSTYFFLLDSQVFEVVGDQKIKILALNCIQLKRTLKAIKNNIPRPWSSSGSESYLHFLH